MLKRLKLGGKLNLLLILIFVMIVAISGFTLSNVLVNNAKEEIASQAFILMETLNSVRKFTDEEITPYLNPIVDKGKQFLPQTVPAYSARRVFEYLRNMDKQYKNYYYKEATLNPTNLRDIANDFEKSIVESFQRERQKKELTGNLSYPSGDYFYVARPIVVSAQSCLRCHSTPDAAPKSQIISYGRENGFNWKLNEIVGAQVIRVPTTEVYNIARRSQFLVIGIISVVFLLGIVLLNLFVKFSVIKPITQMSQHAKQVSTGDMAVDFEHQANDEIGVLAASLNRMKVSLEMAMNMLNQNQSNQ